MVARKSCFFTSAAPRTAVSSETIDCLSSDRSVKRSEKTKSEAECFRFGRRRKGANAVFGNSLWLLPETKLSGLCRRSEKNKSEAKCFGFGRRRKVVSAATGNSLRLLPETKPNGLCKKKKPKLKPSVSGFNLERRSDGVNERWRLFGTKKRRRERYEVRDDAGAGMGT